jgi:hypothetical protein
MLDGFLPADDRPCMTEDQIKTAKRRLFLGIANVGFWVFASTACLTCFAPIDAPPIAPYSPLKWMLCGVLLQALFDCLGGALFFPVAGDGSKRFFSRWSRGVLAHTALLSATGVLGYWSFRLSGGFGPGVAASSLFLLLWRRQILGLVAGVRSQPASLAGVDFWSANAWDPSFTGGICGVGKGAAILLPESWVSGLAGAELETVIQRRRWEVQNQIPARAFFSVVCWNLAGCIVGSWLLDLPGREPGSAVFLQSCWMTLWGFLGLLLLPTVSRRAVFAADQAAAAKGCDVAGWIRKFPDITGEDGNAGALIQRIFYPIPSAKERLHRLGKAPESLVLGNVARMNLFLSLATTTFLGRCVHCNVGRPELWIFAPTD